MVLTRKNQLVDSVIEVVGGVGEVTRDSGLMWSAQSSFEVCANPEESIFVDSVYIFDRGSR